MKTVMITGVGGMDGSILADKHIAMGDKVIGIGLWHSHSYYKNLQNVIDNENFIFVSGDITEKEFMERVLEKYKPDIIYNMAAISLVPESFKIPHKVFDVNAIAVLHILELIRTRYPHIRLYQSSTSEQLGDNTETPQNTESRMLPNSPYAIAKLAAYHLVRSYRNAYGIFASNGMLWNHEHYRRGDMFVTKKIAKAVALINDNLQEYITLGNLDAYRDWGWAEDYMDAAIAIMSADHPDDYAVNTGEAHSVREFVIEAFKTIGLTIRWEGEGINECGIDQNGVVRVKISKEFYRPVEVDYLLGDNTKIKQQLGWEPKIKFGELVKKMVEYEIKELDSTPMVKK